jgi:hypothetical protein
MFFFDGAIMKQREKRLLHVLFSLLLLLVGGTFLGCGGGKSGETDGGGTFNTVAAPTFSIPPGTYTSAQSVTLSTLTPEASIRYTTDGSIPTDTYGTVYSSPISVSASTTIRAVAYLCCFCR